MCADEARRFTVWYGCNVCEGNEYTDKKCLICPQSYHCLKCLENHWRRGFLGCTYCRCESCGIVKVGGHWLLHCMQPGCKNMVCRDVHRVAPFWDLSPKQSWCDPECRSFPFQPRYCVEEYLAPPYLYLYKLPTPPLLMIALDKIHNTIPLSECEAHLPDELYARLLHLHGVVCHTLNSWDHICPHHTTSNVTEDDVRWCYC
jgi:hypothetical protein